MNNIMKHILSGLLLLITTYTLAQSYNFKQQIISSKVLKQINTLKTHTEFHDSAIGYSGRKTETYTLFERIFKTATIQEWTELCNHPQPIIRYYAFYALEKHDVPVNSLIPIAITHLNDTAKIMTMNGCLGYEEVIGDVMFSSIQKEYKRSPKIKTYIDSLFIYSKGPLISRANEYLKTLPKTEKLRQRLQDMVKYENNPHAFDLLLSYNNPEDWTYIRYLLYKHPIRILEGIAKYPKQEFIKPLQWWKTTMSAPYIDPMTWDRLPQNPSIIRGIYKAYMSYEPSIRIKYFTDIFTSKYTLEVKNIHALAIYSLIEHINEEWTNPVKLAILPYLSSYDQQLINHLNSLYPQETFTVIKSVTTRQNPNIYLYGKSVDILTDYLFKNTTKDSIPFLRHQLEKDLYPGVFEIYFQKLTLKFPKEKQDYIIKRLKQIISRDNIEIDQGFKNILRNIKDPKLRYRIWWVCYDYIQLKRESPIEPLLNIMDMYYPYKTDDLCFKYLSTAELKLYPTWDMFNLLWRKRNSDYDKRLKEFYNQNAYTFKNSKFGQYIHQRLYPSQYPRNI